jgi:hypothetical protein
MKYETYRGIAFAQDGQAFEFLSVGHKGSILKRIEFVSTETPDIYNLVLGDVNDDGKINYNSISDNGDRNKILATIVKVIEDFCCQYPERWVYFCGSTRERTRLYRMAVGLNLEELSIKFYIFAEVDNEEEYILFDKNMDIKAFLVKRKPVL